MQEITVHLVCDGESVSTIVRGDDLVDVLYEKAKERSGIDRYWCELTCDGESLAIGNRIEETCLYNGCKVEQTTNKRRSDADSLVSGGYIKAEWVNPNVPLSNVEEVHKAFLKYVKNITGDHLDILSKFLSIGVDVNFDYEKINKDGDGDGDEDGNGDDE